MATLLMSRFSLEQSLFGCCSSCHASFGEEFNSKSWASRERQYALGGSRSIPLPAAVASARGGDERSDWTPRAALASGHSAAASPRTMMSTPPHALLVDMPSTGRRATTPPAARDPAAKAQERARLRQLVNEFTQEASRGRSCTVVVLDSDPVRVNGGARREAQYGLGEEVDRFILRSCPAAAAHAEGEWETLGQWPLAAVLGTHKAEESAIVASRRQELNRIVSNEELGRAAVLEFGGGAFAGCAPLLLIEASAEHCERFVSSMQILRLYKGAAQRLESARNGDSRQHPPTMTGLWTQPPPNHVAASKSAATPTRGGPSTPIQDAAPASRGGSRPVGAVGNDDPVSDGVPKPH